MCGITGIFDSRDRRPIDADVLRAMTDAIAHRGPDGHGYHIAGGIGFGHRRLSIIDIAGSPQPMYNEDGAVVITYNGEIYNYRELAAELAALGHVFRSHGDTETIVHAWEEWGVGCLDRLRGMFAFAIWDERQQTLFVARDRMGEKPVYYSLLPNGLLHFASELKSLLAVPSLPRRIDVQAVEEYFAYGYVPEPRSVYRDVRKLEAGHYLLMRRGEAEAVARPYWDVRFAALGGRGEGDVAEELIARFRSAVQGQMVADVPLGAFLSGGVDSSAVVAMMAGASEAPVNTFSIAFADGRYDESPYAEAMARRYRTHHRSKRVDPEAFDLLDRLARMYDEPFGDSSALPTFRVCAAAREHVTVALSGDGGDELFAGYRRYLWHSKEERLRGLLPGAVRRPLFGALAAVYPKADWAPRWLRAKTTFRELSLDTVAGYFSSISVVNDEVRRRLFSRQALSDLQGYHAAELLERHMAAAGTDDPLGQAQYADLKMYLPGDILTKVDRAAMATSLETRVPLLDHELVGWIAGLPSSLKLNGQTGKYIFKKALQPHVSDDILYRPKQGFSIPLDRWFRGPLRQRLRDELSHPVVADCGLFDTGYIGQLVEQHQSGLRDHAAVLWALLAFSGFMRQVHEAAPPRPAQPATAVA